jgi:hypothetical protein
MVLDDERPVRELGRQAHRLFGHERTAARERCAQAMHCVAETFQQRSLVFRLAG